MLNVDTQKQALKPEKSLWSHSMASIRVMLRGTASRAQHTKYHSFTGLGSCTLT